MKDLRYAVRWLSRNPLFCLAIIFTLALAIGANAAIFSIVNAALFPPLPYKDTDRLVEIHEENGKITLRNYEEFLQSADFLESVASYKVKVWHLAGEQPARIPGYSVSQSFLTTLGVQPVIGRNFTIEEDRSGVPFVVLISDEMWRAVFAADPHIVGRVIQLDGESCEIIGVMPPQFRFPKFPIRQPQFWTTLGFEKRHPGPPKFIAQTLGRRVFTIGRLKPGMPMAEAEKKLNSVGRGYGYKFKLNRLNEFTNRFRGTNASILFLLSGAVLLVLFIACANVSNLLLSRAVTRNREVAIRIALGANRRILLKHFLTESLLLCVIGGAAGMLLILWLQSSMKTTLAFMHPSLVDYWTGIYPNTINMRVLLFIGVVAILTGLSTGIVPAVQSSKTDLLSALKEGGQFSGVSFHGRRILNFFVILQVALSLVLLTGTGLMIRSMIRLQKVDPGFNPNFSQMYISLPPYKYPEPHQWKNFATRILETIRRLPGIRHVAVATDVPVDHSGAQIRIRPDDFPNISPDEEPWVYYSGVTTDFFTTVGANLIKGRNFLESETSRPVIVVNETFTQKFWRGKDPIGKHVRISFEPPVIAQVIGVVGDMKQGIDMKTEPEIYIPFNLQPYQAMTVLLRADFEPNPSDLEKIVGRMDNAAIPMLDVESMRNTIQRVTSRRRATMYLFSFFAIIAVTLSMVGIYSVMSYSINRQTHEIGVRMSLGAKRSDVVLMILKKASVLIMAGASIGLLISLSLSQTLEGFIYGITRNDPATYIFVIVAVLTVGCIASLVPALRASRIDPLIALRDE
jgi:putative ABC transport system permease protein